MSKHKYAGMYWSTRKTPKGYVWTVYSENGDKVDTSLNNEDEDEQYLATETAAAQDAIHAIQDRYQ